MNGQRLRPLGIGDIFDEGFDLYKRNFVFLLLVTAAAIVPLDILLAFVTPRLLPVLFDLLGVTASDAFWLWTVSTLVRMTLSLPLFLLAIAPVVIASADRYLGRERTLGQTYGGVLRRLPGLLLLVVLLGVTLTLSLAVCFVPWLAVATQLFFSLEAYLIEGKGPVGAMKRSGALVNGYGSRVFSCLVLLALVLWVISLGLQIPLAYLVDGVLNIAPGASSLYGVTAAGVQTAQEQIVTLISSGLAHLFLIPFLVCVATVLYYDLCIRREGFDIDLLAAELNYPPLTALGPFLPPVPSYGPMQQRPGMPRPNMPRPNMPRPNVPRPNVPPPGRPR